ncbi:MAG TPA: Uma2 family endonuclease [Tepidisphaeraceae bacterium]|jgi:Uma2 family endonuclease
MTFAVEQPDEQGFVLDNVSWEFYEHLLSEVGDRHIFVTYDRGRLEIMSPSFRHERYAELLGALVRILATELKAPIIGGGSTTFRRRKSEAGLEPDRCFYIQNANSIRGKTELNLAIDPPPDLAIEIEISRRLANRVEVYRRLRMPEIWCDDGTRLQILCLADNGYESADQSRAFPQFSATQLHDLLMLSAGIDETEWALKVREWLRTNHFAR